MESQNGLFTKSGKPIYSYEHIEELRAIEDEKRKKKQASRTFISQRGAQEHVQHSDADMDGTGGNRGGGKANPYSTPVATPSGFRKMGDLEVGDAICTPYDGVQKVEQIFEQGEQTIYVFHFDDGTEVKCMDNHRFYARASQDEPWKVWEARDIMNRYKLGQPYPMSLRRGVFEYVEFPLCGEVKMNEDRGVTDLPLHPFILGFVSGTGYWEFSRKGIRIDGNRFLKQVIWNMNPNTHYSRRDKCTYLTITNEDRLAITRSRQSELAHIPDDYMTASVECRWEYLRGVLIRCGQSKKKIPFLSLPNKKLIEQIAQMARSVGVFATVVQETEQPEKLGWWKVWLKAPDTERFFMHLRRSGSGRKYADMPTKIPVSPDEKILTKKLLYIKKSDNKAQCRCITVSGKEHLYLTDAYTINHNTAMLLTKPLPDITNRFFNGIIFRKNKGDFENIINETKRWYEPLGKYNKSADDMTWNFKYGSHLNLTYFDMPYQEFDDKYRGQQFAYIGIDEAPQMEFKRFKFLTTCCRNTNNIKSRILFTCNPDPLSWLRQFLDWYIGKEDTIYADGKKHPERKGFIIPERSGKIRYFYSPDDNVNNIIWGNNPHEVYLQIKDIADEGWNENLAQYGHTRETYLVKTFRFTKADLLDNKALMELDPDYIKNLYQQPPEVRARELEGNWDIIRTGDDMIQPQHLERIFHNAPIMGDRVRRASTDVAGDGGDNCWTWFRIGNHIQDCFVCKLDVYTTIPLIKAKLREWGVLEENYVYDLQGVGQVFKGAFPNAVQFNNQEACDGDDRKLYDCKKSQCAYLFAQHTQQAEWSIEPTLLDRMYDVHGVTMSVRNILMQERKAIRQDMTKQDRGWCLIHKEQMKHKSLVGRSPDAIESLCQFEVFEIDGDDTEIPSFLNPYIQNVRTFNLC